MISRAFGRHAEGLEGQDVASNPLLAISYAARILIAGRMGDCRPAFLWAAITFQKWVAGRLDHTGWPETLYAYNTSARDLFLQAEKHGTYRILEQTIAPAAMERELIEASNKVFKEWSFSKSKTSTAQRCLEDREHEEWALADLIICGSEFVATALRERGVADEKIHVVPYGFTADDNPEFSSPSTKCEGPLQILCAGTVGTRKGTPSLIAAAKRLGSKVKVTLAGAWDAPPQLIKDLPANVIWLGAVPRSEMRQLYRDSDVLVLPTLCEGSATVCYEACAHGLPIVTTLNSGFPIDDGINGLIIPINDSEKLARTLKQLCEDRKLLQMLATNSRARRGGFSFEAYEQRLLDALSSSANRSL